MMCYYHFWLSVMCACVLRVKYDYCHQGGVRCVSLGVFAVVIRMKYDYYCCHQ